MSTHDEWKQTWDWAEQVWAPDSEHDYSLNTFFRMVANHVAKLEGWEEVGSSDVWHASYDCVRRAREKGVTDRGGLMDHVCEWQGIDGFDKSALMLVMLTNP